MTVTSHTEFTVADWRHASRCRGEDPELFFEIGTTGPALDQIAEAKAVCALCPVADACLTWALGNLEFGVAGGMSADERQAVKRRVARGRARLDDRGAPVKVGTCSMPSTAAGLERHAEIGTAPCPGCAGYAQRCAERIERDGRILELHAAGWSTNAIATNLSIGRDTVRRTLAAARADERLAS